jgi:hypothetical protein
VHCYNILEEYCYFEIQIHQAFCDFAVEKGYCWLKEGLPPRHIYQGIIYCCFETIEDLYEVRSKTNETPLIKRQP